MIGASDVIANWRPNFVIEYRFLVYKIRLEEGDENNFQVSLSITDDKGKSLKAIMGEHEAVKGAFGFAAVTGIVFLDYLSIPRPCVHSVRLSVNNKLLASFPMYVLQSGGVG
jgi:hypothetical protein